MTRPATGASGTPSASASDAGQPLTRPPLPSSFDTAPTTGRCRAFRGSTIRSTPPNPACALEGVGEGGNERRIGKRVEAVLEPQPDDAEHALAPLDPRFDPANELVAEQDRQHVVAPAPPGLRHVDLPDVVEPVQVTQQRAVPDERVERSEERDAGLGAAGRRAVAQFGLRSVQGRERIARDITRTTETLDRHLDELAGSDELGSSHRPFRRAAGGPEPQLGLAAGSQQTVRAVTAQQPVPLLFVRGRMLRQQLRREEALGEVVDAAVAVPPRDPEHPCLRQRLEDGADLVRRAPVPLDRGSRLDIGRAHRAA